MVRGIDTAEVSEIEGTRNGKFLVGRKQNKETLAHALSSVKRCISMLQFKDVTLAQAHIHKTAND